MTKEEAKRILYVFRNVILVDASHIEAFDMAMKALEQEPCEDAISRQAAIDAIDRYYKDKRYITRSRTILSAICRDMKSTMDSLPSVQPEIIHCKECKYGVQDEDKRWYCRSLGCQVGEADGSGFCADAERRTDD